MRELRLTESDLRHTRQETIASADRIVGVRDDGAPVRVVKDRTGSSEVPAE